MFNLLLMSTDLHEFELIPWSYSRQFARLVLSCVEVALAEILHCPLITVEQENFVKSRPFDPKRKERKWSAKPFGKNGNQRAKR
jgi:hypothetical protein